MIGGGGGLTSDQIDILIQAAMANQPTSFVGTGTSMTVAELITNFPPSATYSGKYGRVTDLYGSVDDIMRCRYDGTVYRWVPQRTDFNGSVAMGSSNIAILPLVTPPTLRATGTLLGSIQFQPSVTNAYRGQRQKVVIEGSLGIFTTTITGLIGSNLTVLGGQTKTIEFNGTGWFSAD